LILEHIQLCFGVLLQQLQAVFNVLLSNTGLNAVDVTTVIICHQALLDN